MADLALHHAIQLCFLSSASSPSVTQSQSRPAQLAALLIAGDFKAILLSTEAIQAWESPNDIGISDLLASSFPRNSVKATNSSEPSHNIDPDLPLIRLIIGIACLQGFVQQNWTGPDLNVATEDLFLVSTESIAPPSSVQPSSASTEIHSLQSTAIELLALGGEPAYHLAQQPALLLLAIRIFQSLDVPSNSDSIPSLPWWILRAALVHESLLDDPVPLPSTLVPRLSDGPLRSLIASDTDLQACLSLEIGLSYHLLSQDKPAQEFFVKAARSSGLEYELTGALGKRTKFQVEELSQLVLLARSRERTQEGSTDDSLDKSGSVGPPGHLPEAVPLDDDTLLENTEFAETSASPFLSSATTERLKSLTPNNQPPLYPLDQSLLLSLCLAQHNTTPENGLTASQMSPYLARVISHPRNWSIHTTALLLRARLESTRSRTVERSALQLQALVDQMPTADSAVGERLKYFYQLPLPSKWQMEKELAKRYLSLGVVKSAMEIFERLEMWEEVVRCLTAIERGDKAIEIVKDLLEGKKAESDIVLARLRLDEKDKLMPMDKQRRRVRMDKTRAAKLWCLLGDLEVQKAEQHYLHAWEISGQTSSRAQRSLGAIYLAREDFDRAIPSFQTAVRINPLYARTWFALGCCLVREERWLEAKEAFSRDVAIEEEDGEGWNNLAAVYLRLTDSTDSDDNQSRGIPFSNKQSAFRALQQGLRFARENWRMWQNYMVVAMDVGELSEAARAMSRIVEERAGKEAAAAVDDEVLNKLVDAVIREDWNNGQGCLAEGQIRTSNEGHGLLPIVDRLFEVVILPRVSNSPRVYNTQARLYRWKTDWSAALDCYTKAYRSGAIASEIVERELPSFREAVEEVHDLVTMMEHLGPMAHEQEEKLGLTQGKAKWGDWKFQARSLVRTLMGRVKDSFENEPEYESLTALLSHIRSA